MEFEDFKKAHQGLKDTLVDEFGTANGGPVADIGVDASKDMSKGEYGLMVILTRDARDDEKDNFPDEYQGVPVSYAVSNQPS